MTFEVWLMIGILATTFTLLIFTKLPPAAVSKACHAADDRAHARFSAASSLGVTTRLGVSAR